MSIKELCGHNVETYVEALIRLKVKKVLSFVINVMSL